MIKLGRDEAASLLGKYDEEDVAGSGGRCQGLSKVDRYLLVVYTTKDWLHDEAKKRAKERGVLRHLLH